MLCDLIANSVFYAPERRHNIIAPSVCSSIRLSHFFRVRTVTLSYIEGFWNNLAQMSTKSRQCVTFKNLVPTSKVKVTLSFWSFTLSIYKVHTCVQTVTLSWLNDFKITRQKCLLHHDDVSRLRITSLPQRWRSHIFNFYIITIRINRYTQLCSGCNFVMHNYLAQMSNTSRQCVAA
jgi:hypothetical protein